MSVNPKTEQHLINTHSFVYECLCFLKESLQKDLAQLLKLIYFNYLDALIFSKLATYIYKSPYNIKWY